jgi:glycosyltransferase involved in cell wall biosynthesis
MTESVTAVVPAYNEADTIEQVVTDLQQHTDEVVVVDDGSADDTPRIARSLGATVLTRDVNQGYDRSLGEGIGYAAETDAEIVITFDADGQHSASDIERVIAPIRDGSAAIVVGRRPEPQRVAERCFGAYTMHRFGIDDPLSGFKAYDVAVYDDIGQFDPYPSIGTYLMIAAAKRGYTISQVDIHIDERTDDPRFGHLRANWSMFKALGRGMLFDVQSGFRRVVGTGV